MEESTENWSQGRQLLLQRCKSRALLCLKEHEYSRAFAHFIVVLTVEPAVKGELLNAFLFTLDKVVADLEKQKQVNEVIMCYEQALEVLPHDSHVLHGLATTLFRLGYVECALSYFLKSYQANPFFTPALYCMENLKNALIERWHFVMLNDSERNNAYKRAIFRAIKKGYNCVLDIGAGTGILSMMAIDGGADKVYACEGSEIMQEILQTVLKMNDKPVKSLLKYSTDINISEDIPEKVNLIVTEIFDAGLFGENSLETLNHAWENLLQCDLVNETSSPDSEISPSIEEKLDINNGNCSVKSKVESLSARIIPQSATVYAVPVESERFRQYFRLNDVVKDALNFKSNIVPRLNDEEPYSTEKIKFLPDNCKMLSQPCPVLEANFNSSQNIKELLQGKVFKSQFKCAESGHLDAFVVWFDMYLDDEEVISSSPKDSAHNCCWEQAVFFAFPQSIYGLSSNCQVNDVIEAEFLCQGHLQLQKISINAGGEDRIPYEGLIMESTLIYLLNSYAFGNIINLNLKDISNLENAAVLDISTLPIIGLKSLKDNSSSSLTVLRNQYQTEIEQIQDSFGIPDNQICFKSYENFCQNKMESDFLIVDPVELCGLLKKNVLQDVAVMKMQCLKNTGLVVPGNMELYAILIDSETLKEYSRIVSDDKMTGYKISQVLNAYQCRIHQDIQFSTLPHKKLSEAVKLTNINLNTTESASSSQIYDCQNSSEIEITNSGQVTAIVYWFKLMYHDNFVVDTSDCRGLYKQAACLLEEDVSVSKGDKVCLQWSLYNSCLQIGVHDNKTSVLK